MSAITNLPDNYNLLAPVSFKFQIRKVPTVTYFCQTANIPGVSLGEVTRATPFVDIAVPGDKVSYDDLKAALENWLDPEGESNEGESRQTPVNASNEGDDNKVKKTSIDATIMPNLNTNNYKLTLFRKDGSEYAGKFHIHKADNKIMTGEKHSEVSEELFYKKQGSEELSDIKVQQEPTRTATTSVSTTSQTTSGGY